MSWEDEIPKAGSEPEKQVDILLDELKLSYERNVPITTPFRDFPIEADRLVEGVLVIEVQSVYFHVQRKRKGSWVARATRQRKDQAKLQCFEACVPFETEVLSPHASLFHKTRYTGPMIEIETESGRFLSLTPNHPLFTNRGVIPTENLNIRDHLLMLRGYQNARGFVVRGRIGTLEDKVPNIINHGNREVSSKAYTQGNQSSNGSYEDQNLCWGENKTLRHTINQRGMGILSRDNRWRRNNNIEEGHTSRSGTLQTINTNCEFISRFNGMVTKETELSFNAYRKPITKTDCSRKSISLLGVRHRGHNSSLTNDSEYTTIFNCKETTSQDTVPMDEESFGGRLSPTRLFSYGTDLSSIYPLVELEAINKIRCSYARRLEVFNLTTTTGYYFAEGLLVHNCGYGCLWLYDDELRYASQVQRGPTWRSLLKAWILTMLDYSKQLRARYRTYQELAINPPTGTHPEYGVVSLRGDARRT